MKKKALIIGGSGGLSSRVAAFLLEEYDVWAVTRGIRPLQEGITPIVANRDSEDFASIILNERIHWDVVYDCICMNARHAKQDLEVLSQVTSRLIVVSTDSVYDPYHKSTPQTEEGVFLEEEGDEPGVSYGCNKRRMEEVFLEDMKKDQPSLNITLFRPGHIYGPGFLLGCFPENSRQAQLPELILKEEHLHLVGMGTYLIHPIFVDDLAHVMVDVASNEKTFGEIFCIGGPEAVENRLYYEYIGEALGVEVVIDEIPLKGYLEAHPGYSGHLCHRIYDLSKLRNTGTKLPSTGLKEGLRIHLVSLGYSVK